VIPKGIPSANTGVSEKITHKNKKMRAHRRPNRIPSARGRVGNQHVAGTRRRFGRQAGGDRSQYVDIGKIADELAGQNDRALKGLVEMAIWCVEGLADIGISASTFSCQLNHFVPNPGSRDECQHALSA